MNSGDIPPHCQYGTSAGSGRPPSSLSLNVPTSSSSAERYLPQFKRKVLEFVERVPTQKQNDKGVPAKTGSNSTRKRYCHKESQSRTRTTIRKRAKIFRVHPTTISDWIHEEKRQHERQELVASSAASVGVDSASPCTVTDASSHASQESQVTPIEDELITWLHAQVGESLSMSTVAESATLSNVRLRPRPLSKPEQKCKNQKATVITESKLKLSTFLRSFYTRHNLESLESATDAHERKHLEWLQLWCKRVLNLDDGDGEGNGAPEDRTPKRVPAYPIRFKMEMVEYGKRLGQRATSRLFCISQKRIFDWTTASVQGALKLESQNSAPKLPEHQRTQSDAASESADTERRGHASKFAAGYEKRSRKQVVDRNIEDEVFNWVQSQKPVKVTSTQIRNKARELYRERGFTQIQCSYGWYRRWCKRFDISTSPHDPIDEQVLTWLLQQYDNNTLVTYRHLQEYTRETMNQAHTCESEVSIIEQGFKASSSWATAFFKRNHLLINWHGHYNKELPQGLDVACREFLQRLKTDLGVDERVLVAMDEIPLTFTSTASTPTPNCSINSLTGFPDNQCNALEGKISRLRKITIKNCEATVKLAIKSNGDILSPMIVVKGQKSTNWDQVYTKTDNPVVVYYSKSTEPTVESLEKWVDLILAKEFNMPKKSTQPPLLLWDSYSLHSEMDDKCKKVGIESRMFPGGCSCKLQPVNMIGRELLLRRIEEEWTHYMQESNSDHCSRMNLPSTDDIVDWVYKAFKSMQLQKELLRNSFKILEIGTS